MLNAFFIALRFLTRIPAPEPDYTDAAITESSQFYGWVGLLVGTLVAIPLCSPSIPPMMEAAIAVALMQWLTGGLHADGLSDCADAWVGGRDREHTLAIMKDPHIGAMGVNVLICVLLIQFAALSTLAHTLSMFILIASTCAASRTAAAWLLLTTPYAKPNGLGSPLTQASSQKLALHAVVLFSLLIALSPKLSLISLLSVALVFWLGRTVCLRRLGGITGDTTGALIVLAETVTLGVHALI